jgi:hypothetical protein
MTDAYRDEYENGTIEAVVFSDGRKYSQFDNEMGQNWKRAYEFGLSSNDEFVVPEGAILQKISLKELYDSFGKFAKNCHGKTPDNHGRYGYWYFRP